MTLKVKPLCCLGSLTQKVKVTKVGVTLGKLLFCSYYLAVAVLSRTSPPIDVFSAPTVSLTSLQLGTHCNTHTHTECLMCSLLTSVVCQCFTTRTTACRKASIGARRARRIPTCHVYLAHQNELADSFTFFSVVLLFEARLLPTVRLWYDACAVQAFHTNTSILWHRQSFNTLHTTSYSHSHSPALEF